MRYVPNRLRTLLLILVLALSGVGLPACAPSSSDSGSAAGSTAFEAPEVVEDDAPSDSAALEADESEDPASSSSQSAAFDIAQVPSYTGNPYTVINGNVPAFTDEDVAAPAESYAPLDALGRCGVAMAVVGSETMPTEERGSIGMVKPSGWHTVRYDDLVDGKYLYNRCHLIGYQLTGENANEENLVTGTRYMNVEGMLPFENEVDDYIDATGNHVLYRSTPIFVGDELVCRGVHLEARSVEDDGAGVSFNVFCYNVQPGIGIDYATGESWRLGGATSAPEETSNTSTTAPATAQTPAVQAPAATMTYILNTNTKKFHLPGCASVNRMSDKNKQEFTGTRDEVIAQGYDPCKNCNP